MENVVVKARNEIQQRQRAMRSEVLSKSKELADVEKQIQDNLINGVATTSLEKKAQALKDKINYLQQANGTMNIDKILKDRLQGNHDKLIDEYHQRAAENKKKVGELETKAARLKAEYLKVIGEVAEIDGHTMKLRELLQDLKPYTGKKVVQLELEHLSSVGDKETPCRITDKEQHSNYYAYFGNSNIRPFRGVE